MESVILPFVSLHPGPPSTPTVDSIWNIQWATQLPDDSDFWSAVAEGLGQRSLFLPVWLEAVAQWK